MGIQSAILSANIARRSAMTTLIRIDNSNGVRYSPRRSWASTTPVLAKVEYASNIFDRSRKVRSAAISLLYVLY